MQKLSGTLFVVATPIGNLEDITLRAVNTLKAVEKIACEDTRRTRILLDRYGIKKTLISYYSYNEVKKSGFIIEELKAGKDIALVSDAGMPGISDPGFRIIKEALDNNISLDVIPGPTALINALVLSGKPTNKFVFEGFLPNKSSQRRKRLEFLKGEERTVVIYESPHRLLKLLADINDIMGDAHIVCARELTKKFEEVKRGKVSQLADYFGQKQPKGEFVVVI